MNAVGLSEYVADIRVDNAHFQNLILEEDEDDNSKPITEQMLTIIKL